MMLREATVCFEDNLVDAITISLISLVVFHSLRWFFTYKIDHEQIYGFNM